MLESYRSHFKKTFLLAYPVVISHVGHVVVNVTDAVLIGHLGAVKLAACALGISVFSVFMVFGIGIAYGLTPHIAREFGAKDNDACGRFLVNSLLINIVTGLLVYVGLVIISSNLLAFGQDPEVAREALPFLRMIGLSMLPLMIFLSFKQFAEGLNFTRQAMIITLIADGFNVVLTYGLINGAFSLPRMELQGAGLANFISRCLMMVLMISYVLGAKEFKMYLKQARLKYLALATQWRVLSYGLPAAFQYLFEIGAFALAAVMMGVFGPAYQSAHQIAINIAAATYMAAAGISAATSVRVGNALGEQNYAQLKRAAQVGYILVLAFMALMAVAMVLGRNLLPTLYIQDVEVLGIASNLLIIAAIFQLSDGAQVLGLGALRGIGDVKIPTLITFIAYWVIAIPLAWYWGFELDYKGTGIWLSLLLGLSISASLLYFRLRNRIALLQRAA